MSNAHVVPVPAFFLFLRIAQIVFSLIVFILACYGLSISHWTYGGNGYALFVTLASFIILGYYLLTTIRFTRAYNCWAVLVLECFANVWWLGAFASLAAWAAAWSVNDYDGWDYVLWRRSVYGGAETYRNCMAAAAGIGALIWVLFTITLVVFSLNLHRHRKLGHPYRWNSTARAPRGGSIAAEPSPGPTYSKDYQYQVQSQVPPAEQMH